MCRTQRFRRKCFDPTMKYFRRCKPLIAPILLIASCALLIETIFYDDKTVVVYGKDGVSMRAVADNYPNSKTISNTTPINSGAKVTMTTDLPMIYLITPTVYRTEQKADLTRLSHTLRLVPRIHWIVVEDRSKRSRLIANFLANCKVPHTHLAVRTSVPSKLEAKRYGKLVPGWMIPKGVEQRNLGLDWITNNGEYPSVFYLLDDDNTYDLRLFEEMRYTKRVAVWPVGLTGGARFQSPVLKDGKVIDWATGWPAGRKFAIDMAGFAVNTEMLRRPDPPRFRVMVGKGYTETDFLEQLNITLAELEPKADNCSKVLVWHTRTSSSMLNNDNKLKRVLSGYDMRDLEV